MEQPTLHRLEGISPRAFQHPADRAATEALAQIPGVQQVVRKLTELQYERALRQMLLANSVKIGPQQLPELWTVYERAGETLDLPELPDLYTTYFPLGPNAVAIGTKRPIVVVSSQFVEMLDPDELWSLFGHELGHVLADHVLYTTTLAILLQLQGVLPFLIRLPYRAVLAVLLEWSRSAELTADRAGALACRDPLVSSRLLMVMAAGVPSSRLDLDAFLRQASEYEEWDSRWDRFLRVVAERRGTHPYAVRRVQQLMDWVHGGDYDRILGGHYPRRGESDLRGDADKASEYYVDKMWNLYRDASDATQGFREKVDGWLKRDAQTEEPEDAEEPAEPR
ncbi:MAG TPA: M48 family metallopeptidase [Gaiellaceae bacterium]|nr:M48 family metallopeptidase [Gaiellaceae bacterium]